MTTIHAASALLPTGWAANVRLTIADGRFVGITADGPPQHDDITYAVVLPGMANVHSHAFQRGMAGLAERRGPAADTFWSWRETMYRFALGMTPDQMEAIAAQLYVEMLEAGFCRVGEFHYLHHAEDGRPYDDEAEMATRIVAAAQTAGIGLTLLPVFYAHANFGGLPPTPRQRRFVTDRAGFHRLYQGCAAAIRAVPGAVLGCAPHSLRAVTAAELQAVLDMAPAGPIHIHAAEQVKEVEDCMAWCGARPVAWLLDNAVVDSRWCLIHATHMDPGEIAGLAASGAVAGLCPLTEANLGDGIFQGDGFLRAGGRIGIGSDSNIQISLAGELRQLEYSQRLASRSRNVLAPPGGSTGRAVFDAALAGGAHAVRPDVPAGLAVGADADLVTLAVEHVGLASRATDDLLDAFLFCGADRMVGDVWALGRKVVENGRHVGRSGIEDRFKAAMAQLRAL